MKWCRWRDSNSRLPAYEAGALPLSYNGKHMNKQQYQLNPKQCLACKTPLSWQQYRNGGIYCGHSCSMKHQPRRKRTARRYDCLNCGNAITTKAYKYCSSRCASEYRIKSSAIQIEQGLVSTPDTLKTYLIRRDGYVCQCCTLTEWMGEPIPLELDHIDGNASNNDPGNLRLLCSNCHSLTPTAKGRNRGKGRKSLGIKRD